MMQECHIVSDYMGYSKQQIKAYIICFLLRGYSDLLLFKQKTPLLNIFWDTKTHTVLIV